MFQDQESPLTQWERLVQSLKIFGQAGVLRRPGNVALELWARHDLKDMRTKEPRLAGLAISLCLSDGAYLYARPDWWQEKGKTVSGASLKTAGRLTSRSACVQPQGWNFRKRWSLWRPANAERPISFCPGTATFF